MTPYDVYLAGQQGLQQGRERGLAELVGRAYSAPREERDGLVGMVMKQDPAKGFNALQHFRQMDEQGLESFGRFAVAFDALPDDQKPAAYPEFARQAQQFGIPAPAEWKPEYAPNICRTLRARSIRTIADISARAFSA